MNAMSSVALGDNEALAAQYAVLEAEMAKIRDALADAPIVETQAKATELRPVAQQQRVRKVPAWLLQVAEEAPKNKMTIGQWGPAD